MNNAAKGYIFALLSTLSLANVYIFSKAALQETSLAQFGFYWFGFAILWNFLFTAITGQVKNIKKLSKFQTFNLLGMGIVEIIATVSIFASIKLIANPTIPSLIRNIEPVLIVILSIAILKEKYNTLEKFGVLISILGTILVAYNNQKNLNQLFVKGAELVVISAIFYSIRTIWSKKVIQHFTTQALNLNKVGFLFFTAVIAILYNHETIHISHNALLNLFIGSLIGPFFTSIVQFASLKYIDASRSTMIQSTTGFITMILAYLYFGVFPFTYQIIGGTITIIGLFMITRRSLLQIKVEIKQKRAQLETTQKDKLD